MANYQLLFTNWTELTQIYTKGLAEKKILRKQNDELLTVVEEQKVKISQLEDQLQKFTKGIKMMNSSTSLLDEILTLGKASGDSTGIGFHEGSSIKRRGTITKHFVPAKGQANRGTKRYNWRCHYCGKKGHIAPYCYKLYGRGRNRFSEPKRVWVKKDTVISNVVFTSLKATVSVENRRRQLYSTLGAWLERR
jgi:hypothetical protein